MEQRRRLRRVVDFMGRFAERCGAQDELTLARLAEIACWSPEHFDRVYRRVAAEPPMATVRRLRLKHAASLLQRGHALHEVAEFAGYTSTQAFGRAFQRQFGSPPSKWPGREAAAAVRPSFELVHLNDDIPCHTLRLTGRAEDVSPLFDQTLLRLQRSGSPRLEWQVFGVSAPDADWSQWGRSGGLHVLASVALGPPLSCAPRDMDRGLVKAGTYARIRAQQVNAVPWESLLHDAGWQRSRPEILRHYDTDPAFVAPQERREWFYVPVARRSGCP